VGLFLAQNHSAMTHLPIAAAILAALSAVVAIFTSRREVSLLWALLSIVALVSAMPTVVTGIFAAEGRFNGDGKPYIEGGVLVSNVPANDRVWLHEVFGGGGFVVALALAVSGIAFLRGRRPNKYVVAILALALAILWGIGGHLGGKEMWGPDTFPGFQ
jgi:uncharacterized membrane protein